MFDLLTQAGRAYDLKLAGAYAMDSLRMEKGFRHAGHELDSETSPMEARLMHSVDLNKVIVFHLIKVSLNIRKNSITRNIS